MKLVVIVIVVVTYRIAETSHDSELGMMEPVNEGGMQLKHWKNAPDGFGQPFVRGIHYTFWYCLLACNRLVH